MFIRTPTDFGAAIRDRRKQLGLGQAELAERIGVSRQWIVGVERGRARAELALVLRAVEALDLRLEARPKSTDTARSSIGLGNVLARARGETSTRSDKEPS